MKKLIGLVLSLVLFSGMVYAKTYEVVVDDTVAVYFEQSLDKDITPEVWLGLQAINSADRIIANEYIKKMITDKSRTEKITEIEKAVEPK